MTSNMTSERYGPGNHNSSLQSITLPVDSTRPFLILDIYISTTCYPEYPLQHCFFAGDCLFGRIASSPKGAESLQEDIDRIQG